MLARNARKLRRHRERNRPSSRRLPNGNGGGEDADDVVVFARAGSHLCNKQEENGRAI